MTAMLPVAERTTAEAFLAPPATPPRRHDLARGATHTSPALPGALALDALFAELQR